MACISGDCSKVSRLASFRPIKNPSTTSIDLHNRKQHWTTTWLFVCPCFMSVTFIIMFHVWRLLRKIGCNASLVIEMLHFFEIPLIVFPCQAQSPAQQLLHSAAFSRAGCYRYFYCANAQTP